MRPGQLEIAAGRRAVERSERVVSQGLERRVLVRGITVDENGRHRLG